MQRLHRHLTEGIENRPIANSVGIEVETSFMDKSGYPISVEQSQRLLKALKLALLWKVAQRKGNFITEISDCRGIC